MKLFRAAITSAVFVAISTVSRADPAPAIHYAPAENLEHVDVALIDRNLFCGLCSDGLAGDPSAHARG